METFAKRLEALRTKKNISRVDLALALSLPRNAVEKMESGRLTPGKEQQMKIAEYFGVSLAYLRGESDDTAGGSWLSGNLPREEEAPAPAVRREVRRVVAASGDDSRENSAMFRLLLESDAFRSAVLEVLRSPEGQKLLQSAIDRDKRGY